ncbi:DnaJ domain-containing protein [Rhodoferax saidenbachensis]|uniref:DnaJ-class molecular chaperone n=1 Tax=Rhodoferax saidenbachensis TaxID=1484693 RepID=A0ABU1ZUE0_9BURK|nr:DnaJ domain-containing protein [Rhodoferax saidenbachensis]MDR7308146.1 DnaJ-class molecular chaperone [Rhodoferax saidenbachensis]
MDSAYKVLGVPGNATLQEITQAMQDALDHYSHAKMARDPDVIPRQIAIREAYKILSNEQMRAAHDRKLQSYVNRPRSAPKIAMEEVPPPWYTNFLYVGTLVVLSMFAIGGYMAHARDKARAAQEATILQEKKLAAEALALEDAERRRAEERLARQESENKARERQMAADASNSLRSAMLAESMAQTDMQRKADALQREKLRKESEAKSEERQRVYEAQRRLAADQQRIRELCYQQYRRFPC